MMWNVRVYIPGIGAKTTRWFATRPIETAVQYALEDARDLGLIRNDTKEISIQVSLKKEGEDA